VARGAGNEAGASIDAGAVITYGRLGARLFEPREADAFGVRRPRIRAVGIHVEAFTGAGAARR